MVRILNDNPQVFINTYQDQIRNLYILTQIEPKITNPQALKSLQKLLNDLFHLLNLQPKEAPSDMKPNLDEVASILEVLLDNQ